MSDNVVTIDTKQVDNLFRKLDPEKRNEAMMNALKSGTQYWHRRHVPTCERV